MKIFLIKSQNFNSDVVDVICAYDNETSASQHVEAYKYIYKTELKAIIWYDNLFMKSEFNTQK